VRPFPPTLLLLTNCLSLEVRFFFFFPVSAFFTSSLMTRALLVDLGTSSGFDNLGHFLKGPPLPHTRFPGLLAPWPLGDSPFFSPGHGPSGNLPTPPRLDCFHMVHTFTSVPPCLSYSYPSVRSLLCAHAPFFGILVCRVRLTSVFVGTCPFSGNVTFCFTRSTAHFCLACAPSFIFIRRERWGFAFLTPGFFVS